jgi:hypothetical protein
MKEIAAGSVSEWVHEQRAPEVPRYDHLADGLKVLA